MFMESKHASCTVFSGRKSTVWDGIDRCFLHALGCIGIERNQTIAEPQRKIILSAASLQSFNMNVSRVYGFHDAALFGTRPAKHTVLHHARDGLKTCPTLH
jgi:hypothetical protein